jgi:hypothetical protein
MSDRLRAAILDSIMQPPIIHGTLTAPTSDRRDLHRWLSIGRERSSSRLRNRYRTIRRAARVGGW